MCARARIVGDKPVEVKKNIGHLLSNSGDTINKGVKKASSDSLGCH